MQKYPPSTIMKSYQFIMCLEDLTRAHAKISSKTLEEFVCNLMKGLHTRSKTLISPMPLHVQALLQNSTTGNMIQDTI